MSHRRLSGYCQRSSPHQPSLSGPNLSPRAGCVVTRRVSPEGRASQLNNGFHLICSAVGEPVSPLIASHLTKRVVAGLRFRAEYQWELAKPIPLSFSRAHGRRHGGQEIDERIGPGRRTKTRREGEHAHTHARTACARKKTRT